MLFAILALIDDDLVVQVDLLHRFMGYRKLLVARVIYLSLRSQGSEGKYFGSIAISLVKTMYTNSKNVGFCFAISFIFPTFANVEYMFAYGCLFQNLHHISNMQTQMYLLIYQGISRKSSNDRVMF